MSINSSTREAILKSMLQGQVGVTLPVRNLLFGMAFSVHVVP